MYIGTRTVQNNLNQNRHVLIHTVVILYVTSNIPKFGFVLTRTFLGFLFSLVCLFDKTCNCSINFHNPTTTTVHYTSENWGILFKAHAEILASVMKTNLELICGIIRTNPRYV